MCYTYRNDTDSSITWDSSHTDSRYQQYYFYKDGTIKNKYTGRYLTADVEYGEYSDKQPDGNLILTDTLTGNDNQLWYYDKEFEVLRAKNGGKVLSVPE